MIDLIIPPEFAIGRVYLTWKDISWAYHEGFITWRGVTEHAANLVVKGNVDPDVRELATIGKEQIWRMADLLDGLATRENGRLEDTKEKWLFLCLEWIYQNRNEYENPFSMVDAIYADFDYPSLIEPFVSYMPPSDGYDASQFSKQENIKRLTKKWDEFLTAERVKWAAEVSAR
jgi:hypothetical protein